MRRDVVQVALYFSDAPDLDLTDVQKGAAAVTNRDAWVKAFAKWLGECSVTIGFLASIGFHSSAHSQGQDEESVREAP